MSGGRGERERRLAIGSVRIVIDRRGVAIALLAAIVVVALVLAAVATGPLAVPPGVVVETILGGGTSLSRFAVLDLGLPRAVAGALIGIALGAAGALVQALTRNPLGSPDVLGFEAGAATGAIVGLLALRLQPDRYVPLAVVTGLVAAAAVMLLGRGASRDGGYRLILVGVGIGALLESVNGYLLTRSRALESQVAVRWLAGSLNGVEWTQVLQLLVGLVVLLPIAVGTVRPLRAIALGTDAAISLGVRLRATTVVLLVVAVGLGALAVAVAGPIGFVALAAPHLAAGLTRSRGPQPLLAGAVGAVLVTASDLIGQRLIGDHELPVGVVTGAVGGLYLAGLLATEWRRQR